MTADAELDSDDADRLLATADRRRDQGAWLQAAQFYARVVLLRPEAWPLRVQEGHCLKEAGKAEEALDRYRDAERQAPEDADLQLQIGHAHKLLGQRREAALAYARAVELDPGNADARREAHASESWLAENNTEGAAPSPAAPGPEVHPAAAELPATAWPQPVAAVTLVLDVSDVLDYFNGARTPTGIQRVQIGIVNRAIAETPPEGLQLSFAAFDPAELNWRPVDGAAFATLCALSASGSDTEDPDWTEARDTLREKVAKAPPVAFAPGALLVNLGNSFGFAEYFRALRAVQERDGVRYVPFVHDCVPLIVPEHCLKSMVQDYARWFSALGLHAHGLLCNSENTLRDVTEQMSRLQPGFALPGHVVRLDADPRSVAALSGDVAMPALRVLRPGERFALFVSTIESRKNHLLVFSAWLQLLRRHGPSRVPRLVCVGKQGWHAEAALNLLQNAPELQRHVVLLSRISDLELDALYRRCSFTVYNSHYEGWGLPVTEALAHGKVVITPRHSSLTEAGGEAALYFTPQDMPGLEALLERVMFDDAFRAAQEAVVLEKGRPRSWSAVKDEVFAALRSLAALPPQPEARPRLTLGQRYLCRSRKLTRPDPHYALAEMARQGPGWYPLEEWGVWCRGGLSTLRLALPPDASGAALRLYLQVHSPPVPLALSVRCHSQGATIAQFEVAVEPEQHPTLMLDLPPADLAGMMDVDLDSGAGIDLSHLSPADTRCIGIGLSGFMLCHLDDHAARLGFLEQQSFVAALP